jgi:hypothetical protein
MAFVATYERPGAGDYERHVARVARTWMSIMKARHSVQGIVNRVVDEFSVPPPDDYGCGWFDLRERFLEWAVREEWLEPDRARAVLEGEKT